jgi:hypothetical protein
MKIKKYIVFREFGLKSRRFITYSLFDKFRTSTRQHVPSNMWQIRKLFWVYGDLHITLVRLNKELTFNVQVNAQRRTSEVQALTSGLRLHIQQIEVSQCPVPTPCSPVYASSGVRTPGRVHHAQQTKHVKLQYA